MRVGDPAPQDPPEGGAVYQATKVAAAVPAKYAGWAGWRAKRAM